MGLVGLCCLVGGLTAFVYHPAPKPMAAPASASVACESSWRALGYQVTPGGADIQVFAPLRGNAHRLLAEASLGVSLCHPGYTLNRFCMGLSCPRPGITATLSPAS